MVGLGIRQEDICLAIRDGNDKPISLPTLLKYFRKEIDTGVTNLNSMVGNFMVATILGMPVPEGVTPITNENARASFAQSDCRTWQLPSLPKMFQSELDGLLKIVDSPSLN